MVERIRILLQSRQLTPTQFADAIGVARPIVSHILSGRNKPSLEVVQKIIGAFPDLSLPWLLSGIGPMIALAEPVGGPLPATAAAQPPTATDAVEGPIKRNRPANEKSLATTAAAVESSPAPVPVETPVPVEESAPAASQVGSSVQPIATAPVAAAHSPEAGQNAAVVPLVALAEPGKKIRRIVIFYQDGTFSDYQPE